MVPDFPRISEFFADDLAFQSENSVRDSALPPGCLGEGPQAETKLLWSCVLNAVYEISRTLSGELALHDLGLLLNLPEGIWTSSSNGNFLAAMVHNTCLVI